MKKIIIGIVIIGLLTLIGFKLIGSKKNQEITTISTFSDLFPKKEGTYSYKVDGKTKKVQVKVNQKEDKTTITMIYDTEEKTSVNRIYEVNNDKIIEFSKSYQGDKVVSEETATEILNSFPYVGLTYKSVDRLITYEITEMKNNKVTIVSTQKLVDYEKNKPVEKEYKVIRIFEKGKGLVLYQTDYNGSKNTILKIK